MKNKLFYEYIDNKSTKLLIAISNMSNVINPGFQCYKTYNKIFNNYNILFIKDSKIGNWYIDIIDEIKELIIKYISINKEVYIITSSSGGFISLHIIPIIYNLKVAICVNIQFFLEDTIFSKYDDIYHVNIESLNVDNKVLYPMINFPKNTDYKIYYYSSDTNLDAEFATYVESFNLPQFIITREGHLNMNHYDYIIYKLKYTDTNTFYNEIVTLFNNHSS